MSESKEKPYRLLEVLLASFAVVISITALVITTLNQQEQDRRWDKVNLGRIDITEVDFLTFRVVEREKLKTVDLGVETSLSGIFEDGLFTNKFKISFGLVLWDKTKDARFNFELFNTKSEILNYMKVHKLDSNKIGIYRHYVIGAKLKNIGNSTVENVITTISSNLDKEVKIDPNNISNNQLQGIRYSAQRVNVINYKFFQPLDKELPDSIDWNITVNYKDANNKLINETFYFKYDGFSWINCSPPENTSPTAN